MRKMHNKAVLAKAAPKAIPMVVLRVELEKRRKKCQ
jgi:hypothetical protein